MASQKVGHGLDLRVGEFAVLGRNGRFRGKFGSALGDDVLHGAVDQRGNDGIVGPDLIEVAGERGEERGDGLGRVGQNGGQELGESVQAGGDLGDGESVGDVLEPAGLESELPIF